MKFRVSQYYTRLTDALLVTFGKNVGVKMTGNAKFADAPIPPADVTAQANLFQTKLQACENGGREETAQKNAERVILIAMLQKEAAYVQIYAGDSLPDLLSSGFVAASKNRARIELPAPEISRVENLATGQIGMRFPAVPTAYAYQARYKTASGEYQDGGIFTSSRSVRIVDLTPGTVYELQIRAVGGITGYSDWSNPVSLMAT